VGLFGTHNALNATAALACIHALHLDASARIDNCDATAFDTRASRRDESLDVSRALVACGSFEGVKRRFEFVGSKRDITVFDDFAHHPTAIHTTLEAFRSYLDAAGVTGRLVACFDPRNATMRRRVLQDQLAHSFDNADIVLLGKIAVDKRLADDEILDSNAVARAVGEKCQSFSDNDALRQHLVENLRPGDTVVFMSSGAFDGLPRKLLDSL
jgi:UDP-N-acetylmuramate: L-alanyl-gamma-D-glutamyl-meso-diaminopimelate ligase